MNAAEIIKKDLDAIYIGNLSTVDDDLTLPENGKYGAQFTWETGEERFIDNTGKVHRPLHGMGNRKVTLTVTATYEGCSESREYVATVLQEAKENIVKEVRKVVLNALVLFPFYNGSLQMLPFLFHRSHLQLQPLSLLLPAHMYSISPALSCGVHLLCIRSQQTEASAEIH